MGTVARHARGIERPARRSSRHARALARDARASECDRAVARGAEGRLANGARVWTRRVGTRCDRGGTPAFLRRLGVTIEFPMPEAPERRRLWGLLLPSPDLRDATIDLEQLAHLSQHLAGGDIRNAVVAAVLLSDQRREPLGMRHLLIALVRELRRMGRLVDVSRFAAVTQSTTSTTPPAPSA